MSNKITPLRLSENERLFLKTLSETGRIIDGVRLAMRSHGYTENEKEFKKSLKRILTNRARKI